MLKELEQVSKIVVIFLVLHVYTWGNEIKYFFSNLAELLTTFIGVFRQYRFFGDIGVLVFSIVAEFFETFLQKPWRKYYPKNSLLNFGIRKRTCSICAVTL